jgi:hypothetical protein
VASRRIRGKTRPPALWTSFSNGGNIQLVHYFQFHPPAGVFPSDEVPTCIVQAHGHVWEGRFERPPLPYGQVHAEASSGCWRERGRTAVSPDGCGTANDDDGVIYLVNLWTTDGPPAPNTGSVVRYDVERGSVSTVTQPELRNMLVVSQDRTPYVSANSVCPPNGVPPRDCQLVNPTSGVLLKSRSRIRGAQW